MSESKFFGVPSMTFADCSSSARTDAVKASAPNAKIKNLVRGMFGVGGQGQTSGPGIAQPGSGMATEWVV